MTISFRQAEKSLYSFPAKLIRWQDILLDLYTLRQETDCHAQSYEASHASEGTHSEPPASYYMKVEGAENSLRELGRSVIPVMRLRNFLKNSASERYRTMFLIMELRYFEKWELHIIAEHLQKSLKTIARRKHELIDLTIEELERGVFDYELEYCNRDYPLFGGSRAVSGIIHLDPGAEPVKQDA